MALNIYDTLKPQGTYPAVMANDVQTQLQPGSEILQSGIYYRFGEVSGLAVELAADAEGSANEYVFEFIPMEGFEKPVIVPEPKWLGDPQFPVGKTCVVSVCAGLAVSGCG